MNNKQGRTYSILLIFILVVILYHLFGYTGHFGYDDLHYAELAADLLKGSFDFEDHYFYRLPVILFTALSYLIFGISDFASALPALVLTIAILIIVFNTLREHGSMTIIIGLSLCTISNWFLFYSDKLMPDIYVALSVIWALAIIHRYKYKSERTNTALYAILFTFSLLFGFISKGTIVLMLPLLLFLLITDIIQNRDLKFWLFSGISGIGMLLLYFFIIWLFTGDPMKRFNVIADNSYLNPCSYDQQSLRILLKRIFWGFFELSIFQSLATGFIFVFAKLFQRRGLSFFRLKDSFSFFLVSAVILFLSSNFMTISVNAYAPMCLDPRHYLFLLPVAAIPASRIIANYVESKDFALQLIIALFAITIISFFLQGNSFWKLYLPLSILFSAYLFTKPRPGTQQVFILIFVAILFLIPLEMVIYAQKVKYREQRKIAMEQVLGTDRAGSIISNEVQKRLLHYYAGFDFDRSFRIMSYKEFEADTAIEGTKLMLLNDHTRYLSGMSHKDLPYYVRHISPENELIFENKELNIALYELREFTIPEHSEFVLLSSINDFENPLPLWKQDDRDLSEDIKYAGAKSNRVRLFSSTFEYPLDSLQGKDFHNLFVQCSLFSYAEDKTSARIIVSLENNGEAYFWKALELDKYIRAYSNWWPVSFNVAIPQTDFKSESSLKIYVWNKDEKPVHIDNFGIRIVVAPGL